jgi:hypothetical protein
MLMMSFQLASYWGSRTLLIVLSINLFIPVIAISLISPETLKKHIGHPSDTDKFMHGKGKNTSWSEAKNRQEFWLTLLTFGIVIGIARMMDDNANIISLSNSNTSQTN